MRFLSETASATARSIKARLPSSYSASWTSYAQSGEDLIVRFIFGELGIRHPSYMDIGANHPYIFSNTALFYLSGSKGITIEPDPDLFRGLRRARKRDTVLNMGIGTEETEATIYLMEPHTLNTFSEQYAQSLQREHKAKIRMERRVPISTVNRIVEQYAKGRFPDFLSLDTEQFDYDIIRSINFDVSYPMVICVETLSYSTVGRGTKDTELIEYLQHAGYLHYADTNINSIFVRRDLWER